MAFETIVDLDCESTTGVGGTNKETGKPNPKSVEGYFIGSRTVESKYGPSQLHIFKTAKGNIGVWGKTDIDQKLSCVKAGTMTRVTFDRTVPSNKGNDKWVYKVEYDRENKIAVAESTPAVDSDAADADYSYEGEEAALDAGDEGFTTAEEPPVPQPRRPTTPAKPNAARTQALLSGRKSA